MWTLKTEALAKKKMINSEVRSPKKILTEVELIMILIYVPNGSMALDGYIAKPVWVLRVY